jgi:hypothetical protein
MNQLHDYQAHQMFMKDTFAFSLQPGIVTSLLPDPAYSLPAKACSPRALVGEVSRVLPIRPSAVGRSLSIP